MKLIQGYTVTAPFRLFLASMLIMFLFLLAPAAIPFVQASPAASYELTATTDRAIYGRNQTITVSGTLAQNGQPLHGRAIGIQVNDPHGGVHAAKMTSTATDGYYAVAINPSATAPYGTYTVYVAYQEARATTSCNLTSQPPADTMPPEIHAIDVTHITPTTAVVTWMTSEPSTGHIAYGDSAMPHTTEPGEHDIRHQASLIGLQPDTTIHYRIHVHDSSGNHNTSSSHTFTTHAATGDTTPPTRVTNLTATPAPSMYSTYGGTIHLQWSPASDNQAVDHYNIYRDRTFIAAVNATATGVHDTELAVNHTYTYRVSAVDTSGNEGARSQPATASTTMSPMPFTIDSIDVQPAEIETGETATVTVHVSNPSNQTMSHILELFVNGTIETSRNITIPANETATITFNVTKNATGTYPLAIGDATATLTVTSTADSMPLPSFIVIGAFLLALLAASHINRGERP